MKWVLLFMLALVGCSSTTPVTVLATDADLIAAGLQAQLPVLAQDPHITPVTLAKLQSAVTQIQTDANEIRASVAIGQAINAATAQQIASLVGLIATEALPLVPGGAAVVPVVRAAQALLPGILAMAGVPVAGAPAGAYSPVAARLILRGAAGG